MPKMTPRKEKQEYSDDVQTGTDIFSPEKRSEIMSKVRSKDSLAEIKVRSALHAAGFRFRLHRKDLPGTPDILLPKHRLAIFVHGCFWHRHEGCPKASTPKSNKEFWDNKFNQNVERDNKARMALEKMGWRVLIIWECSVNKKGSFDLSSLPLIKDLLNV
jgi:DNA mismatch endonuclease (patch repair protein)